MGVKAEEIDTVFCNHLHVDHVGWNTQKADGRWAPTFPLPAICSVASNWPTGWLGARPGPRVPAAEYSCGPFWGRSPSNDRMALMTDASTSAAPAPMEGHGAYNRGSRVQAAGLSPAVPLLQQAAGKVPLD